MPHTPSDRVKDKRRVKKILIKELGGKCVDCGIDDYYVLQFDHINDDGYKDKQYSNVRKNRTIYHYYKIYNQNKIYFFKIFQLMCANCNQKKELKRREEKYN